MEIRARCKLNLDTVKALIHLLMFKKANPKKRMLFWSIIYGVLMAVVVLELAVFGADSSLFVMLGIIVFVFLYVFYSYFLLPKIRYKALKKMKDVENEYIFCDNVLKASTKNEEYSGLSEMEYSLFIKVYETSEYFFLCQFNKQFFAVDKSTIEGGTAEDIRRILSAYIDKYIACNY